MSGARSAAEHGCHLLSEIGRGSAAYIVGFRSAMVVTGGFALILSSYWPWQWIYWLMAALVLGGLLLTDLRRGSQHPRRDGHTGASSLEG